jgi:hypothetical protein
MVIYNNDGSHPTANLYGDRTWQAGIFIEDRDLKYLMSFVPLMSGS